MKILIIHNRYRERGGEDRVAELQAELLTAQAHEVLRYERSYDEIKTWRLGRISSFFSSFYNHRSVCEIKAIIADFQPDVALIHNIFPVISPAILPLLHRAKVGVIHVVHNYRLVCPTGVASRNGQLCCRCPAQSMAQCVAHQCEGSLFGSIAFALRSMWARHIYRANVDFYSAVSSYVLNELVRWGQIPFGKSGVLGNPILIPETVPGIENRKGVLFVGRFEPAKGATTILEVARRLPDIDFTVTGQKPADAPSNIRFVGMVDRATLDTLYAATRIVANPSFFAETFGLVTAEGMAAGAVAIVSERGALTELVADEAGVSLPADDVESWVQTIRHLHTDDALWQKYAQRGRNRIIERYAAQNYAAQLYRQIELAIKPENI